SGGSGHYRGGDGIIRRLRFNEPMTVTTLSSHRRVSPHGACGGDDGLPGENGVERANGLFERLSGNDQSELSEGDVFVIKTPGGGGYGAPG
ncbi:MAG: hydantoinase B/oxoprolinase family protein, partial [Pseudomonadota bacterium]